MNVRFHLSLTNRENNPDSKANYPMLKTKEFVVFRYFVHTISNLEENLLITIYIVNIDHFRNKYFWTVQFSFDIFLLYI